MRFIFLLFLVSGSIFIFESCQHDPDLTDLADDQNGGEPSTICDPDTVYFANDLLPLVTSTCARSGCHDAASAADGVVLTDYASVFSTADVRPGDPEGSDFYEVLVEDDPDKRMPPPPNETLNNDQIQMVYTWIQQGALNLECTLADCDLDNVTYSQTVVPNLESYGCINCHRGNFPSGGVLLADHSSVSQIALSGRLMGAVKRLEGYAPMPPSGEPMGDCHADQIQKWIDDETPNN